MIKSEFKDNVLVSCDPVTLWNKYFDLIFKSVSTTKIFEKIDVDFKINVHLIDNFQIKKLNSQFLNNDYETDVLAFNFYKGWKNGKLLNEKELLLLKVSFPFEALSVKSSEKVSGDLKGFLLLLISIRVGRIFNLEFECWKNRKSIPLTIIIKLENQKMVFLFDVIALHSFILSKKNYNSKVCISTINHQNRACINNA